MATDETASNRVLRIAETVLGQVQSTPELHAVIELLKPVYRVRRAQDEAIKAIKVADARLVSCGPKESR